MLLSGYFAEASLGPSATRRRAYVYAGHAIDVVGKGIVGLVQIPTEDSRIAIDTRIYIVESVVLNADGGFDASLILKETNESLGETIKYPSQM